MSAPNPSSLEWIMDVAFTAAVGVVVFLIALAFFPVKTGEIPVLAIVIAVIALWYAWKWCRSHLWIR